MRLAVLGLSITSSWGNGHATTYRGLLREMARLGHEVTFFERDVPWYAGNRDLPAPPFCRTVLYPSLEELFARHGGELCDAECVMVGSYVPEGIALGTWVTSRAKGITAFYDIDTPVTLARVEEGRCAYLDRTLIPRYRLYLSFTGGPTLARVERSYGSPAARPLYCSVDPEVHYPVPHPTTWDLGYMGTYSSDRQPGLEHLLCAPARSWREGRFVVAGAQYPAEIAWPANTQRIEHLPPREHRDFYCAQRFTLNITRKDMLAAGYSPSVRLFEAAACGVPVISDRWPGIQEFFTPGEEILVAATPAEVLSVLKEMSDQERTAFGERARRKVLGAHSARQRALELTQYLSAC